jgi:glycosyltransferase involved in cell wall biosynthesis
VLVSILIPCHNAERWVGAAIESALHQFHRAGYAEGDKEIIVVDDGSTDRSVSVIQNPKWRRLVKWETGPNRGSNAARNRLLELARGKWLQYLDADDYLLMNKVSRQMTYLNRHPGTDVLYSAVHVEYREGVRVWRDEASRVLEFDDPWVSLARWRLPQTGGALWKRKALVDAGGWNEKWPCCQEHELYFRLLAAGGIFTHCPHGGAVYRQWKSGSVSTRNHIEFLHRRLQLEQCIEDHLNSHDMMTPERQCAIDRGRAELQSMLDAERTSAIAC